MSSSVRLAGRLAICVTFAATLHAAPTYSHDVAPIIYRHCSSCHRPGESGPFSLLSYDNVRRHATQIADLTKRRIMPPWLPESGKGEFKDELRLSEDQIRTIADWVAAGAIEGDPAETPPAPKFTEGWQLGTPDLIIEAPTAFALPAAGTDIYWNFVIPVNIPSTRWVRAIEIRPGDKRLVHHANLYVDRARSARRQESPPGAGFGGMDPIIERSIFEPDDGAFLYWKPGGIPYSEPAGFAWRLDPGNDLVLNAHMQASGKPEQVRPSIGLYFTDQPKARRFPMLLQLEHDGALNIPAGAADFVVADDFKLPMDCSIYAIYPHAHNLGHVLEAYATLPASWSKTPNEKKWLIRIPNWDRNWESVYRYQQPVFLPKDTVISMRFHYDNSASNPRNPNHPPKRVQAGNKVSDEMGHLWLQVLPADGRDHRLELEETVLHHTLEKYPTDADAHLHLGAIKMARLDSGGAVSEFEAAIHAQPNNAEAHNLYGSALDAVGRRNEAIAQYAAALKINPEYHNARYNLARTLIRVGKPQEAVDLYRQVVAAYPNDAQAHNGLAELLFGQGNFAEAKTEFDRAYALDPTLTIARRNAERAAAQLAAK